MPRAQSSHAGGPDAGQGGETLCPLLLSSPRAGGCSVGWTGPSLSGALGHFPDRSGAPQVPGSAGGGTCSPHGGQPHLHRPPPPAAHSHSDSIHRPCTPGLGWVEGRQAPEAPGKGFLGWETWQAYSKMSEKSSELSEKEEKCPSIRREYRQTHRLPRLKRVCHLRNKLIN